jgi:catechol 2,3-dioxygenase-like lactoylglutathione lyase family enzyme
MITGLDHALIVCPSIDDGEAAYSALLGREPDWRSNDPGGSATIIFQLENTALEIMSPAGGGPLARRLHAMIDQDGPGLKSLIFATDDINEARAMLDRRALKPDEIVAGESVNQLGGKARYWSRLRLDDAATHGVRIFALQRRQPDPLIVKPGKPDAVVGLDHVVINTANPERAVAFYGGRLGLRLALDRANPDWDMRLLFFRTGALTIELAHKISAGVGNQPDKLWGLSWRVPDVEAAHARLEKASFALTPVRAGRRPGTRVFSVKDGALNTPTLILSAEPAQ